MCGRRSKMPRRGRVCILNANHLLYCIKYWPIILISFSYITVVCVLGLSGELYTSNITKKLIDESPASQSTSSSPYTHSSRPFTRKKLYLPLAAYNALTHIIHLLRHLPLARLLRSRSTGKASMAPPLVGVFAATAASSPPPLPLHPLLIVIVAMAPIVPRGGGDEDADGAPVEDDDDDEDEDWRRLPGEEQSLASSLTLILWRTAGAPLQLVATPPPSTFMLRWWCVYGDARVSEKEK